MKEGRRDGGKEGRKEGRMEGRKDGGKDEGRKEGRKITLIHPPAPSCGESHAAAERMQTKH